MCFSWSSLISRAEAAPCGWRWSWSGCLRYQGLSPTAAAAAGTQQAKRRLDPEIPYLPHGEGILCFAQPLKTPLPRGRWPRSSAHEELRCFLRGACVIVRGKAYSGVSRCSPEAPGRASPWVQTWGTTAAPWIP